MKPWQSATVAIGGAVVCYVSFFQGLTALGFVGPDEPRYAAVAREIANSGDWVTPRLDGEVWLEKPILYYWTAATFYRVWGDSELAARLPSAFAATGTAVAVGWLAWRQFGAATAGLALIMFSTMVGAVSFSRAASPDMLFTASCTLALCGTVGLLHDGGRRAEVVAGLGLALALLAKGPAALVLMGGSVLGWAAVTGRWARLTAFRAPLVLVVAGGVTLPWYLLCGLHNPELVEVFFVSHNVERYFTDTFGHQQPLWYFGPVLLIGLLPWTAGAPLAAAQVWHGIRRHHPPSSPVILLVCWSVWPIVFFSLSQSKLPGYVLPAVPVLAVLLARSVGRRLEAGYGSIRVFLLSTAGVWTGLGVALLTPPIAARLPHAIAATRTIGAAAILTGLGVAMLTLTRRPRAALVAMVAGLVLTIWQLNTSLLPGLDVQLSSRATAHAALSYAPADRIVVYRLHRAWRYGLNYYLGRVVPEWDPQANGGQIVVTTERVGNTLLESVEGARIVHRISAEAVLVDVG